MVAELLIPQLDGSAFAGQNCVAASSAMWLYRASNGKTHTTGAHIRALSGDTKGGLELRQVKAINDIHYEQVGPLFNGDFDRLDALSDARGFILLGRYKVLAGGVHDCFRGNFFGNHAVYVSKRNADGTWRVGDPGADGRYSGCPDGFQTFSNTILREFAGTLLSGLPPHTTPIGLGQCNAYLTPHDSSGPIVNPPNQPPIVNVGTGHGVDTMISQSGFPRYQSGYVISLAKGQTLFKSPGGKKATAMSKAGDVPYVGNVADGSGWHAIQAVTGAPYVDKKPRLTVLYVPHGAGILKHV